MPDHRRRGVVPRRRRRDDEGEDESSTAGDLDDVSISEGSALSNGDDEVDAEGSEASVEDQDPQTSVTDNEVSNPANNESTAQPSTSKRNAASKTAPRGSARASTNGLQTVESTDMNRRSQDDVDGSTKLNEVDSRASASAPQLSQPQETSSEKVRREHLEYIKQKNSNPAFVPNRGGFFLHDDRSGSAGSPYGRPIPRGRGRGFNAGYGAGRGYGQPTTGPTDQPWAHDLHETVNKSVSSPPMKETPTSFQIPTAKPASIAPNRTFSISTVLGNVTIQVFLPGMEQKKTFQNLVKRQHTLLPQHRPPLRRDKPVRISIPDEEPRYIFPSTERSFIFIPRAMRPNQQIYTRGRGRGSFHGSRRPSILGSAYTPSIAMSRRSSLGGVGSTGVHTPTDGNIPRGPMMHNFNRPVVRMPITSLPPTINNISAAPFMPVHGAFMSADHNSIGPTILHSPPVVLPMHQPRPQKTVSVAEIESPAVKGPQQQQEQPFHQQMPPGVSLTDGLVTQQGQGQAQPSVTMGTPLSHIPEGAVYARPFQPYPVYPQQGFYGPAYPGGPVVFHVTADPYSMAMGGPVLPPQFTPGQPFVPAPQPSEAGMQQNAMAHETNGMVYYYDQPQFSPDGSQMSQYPQAVGGGMVGFQPANAYYYPTMPGGMYYGAGQ